MNSPGQLVLRPSRVAGRGTALVMIAAAVAACGPATPPTSGQGTPAQPSTQTSPAGHGSRTGNALAACAIPELRVTLDNAATGAAEGSSYVPLGFTNTSAGSCTVSGYPAVTFASGPGGPQVGAAAAAEQNIRSATLTLAPGAIAHAWLQVADAANYPASQCQPVRVGGMRVRLAGAGTAAFVAHPLLACARSMPGSIVLAVFPVQAGQAVLGTAP